MNIHNMLQLSRSRTHPANLMIINKASVPANIQRVSQIRTTVRTTFNSKPTRVFIRINFGKPFSKV